MITLDNLPVALLAIGFTAKGKRYHKTIDGVALEVRLDKAKIIYPTSEGLIVNAGQTCNLSANENFVVLECVNRLLEKGYKPQHIELEPKWQLGRGASGGRADILVKDNHGKPLLIIECKTPAPSSAARGPRHCRTVISFSATRSRSAKPSFCAGTHPTWTAERSNTPVTSSRTATTSVTSRRTRTSRASAPPPT